MITSGQSYNQLITVIVRANASLSHATHSVHRHQSGMHLHIIFA